MDGIKHMLTGKKTVRRARFRLRQY